MQLKLSPLLQTLEKKIGRHDPSNTLYQRLFLVVVLIAVVEIAVNAPQLMHSKHQMSSKPGDGDVPQNWAMTDLRRHLFVLPRTEKLKCSDMGANFTCSVHNAHSLSVDLAQQAQRETQQRLRQALRARSSV